MNTLVKELEGALQPKAIAEPGTEGGPGFILAKPEWISIQAYVNNAQALPLTDDQFRNTLGAEPSFDMDDFRELLNRYNLISQHTTVWKNETFPSSVELASQIYQYGAWTVPVYYPEVRKLANQLENSPENQLLQQKMKAILESLQTKAQGFADEAMKVSNAVKAFADETQSDKEALSGKDGLKNYYECKYGRTSSEGEKLNKEINDARKDLADAKAEYDHFVIVSATTPSYAWVCPFGTVAAAVVAGVYGEKATEALNRANAAQEKINKLSQGQAQNTRLMKYLDAVCSGVDEITGSLVAALPAVQKIQGVWSAMAGDLGRIVEIINQDIRKAIPLIMNLGVDHAMLAWEMVAAAADAYRQHAFIQEQPGSEGSLELHRLKVLVLGEVA